MNFFQNTSLRAKIVATTLLISFIVSLVMTSFSAFREYARVSQDFTNRLRLEVNILGNSVGSSLMFADKQAMKETVNSFFSDETILQIMIFDANEVLYFESNRINKGVIHDHTRTFDHPVVFDDKLIGRVRVLAANKELDRVLYGIFFSMVMSVTIVMVLVLILSTVFQRFILSPIYDFFRVINHVEKTQDYAARVDYVAKDELGQLGEMLNKMLEKIEARDNRLERSVEQRAFELEKITDEFRHRALHDALTGLPNAALLSERFFMSVEHAQRSKAKFSLVLLDIDNFGTINQLFGHVFGDQVLLELTRRLKDLLRKEDLVCRLGGDEFIILLNDLSSLEALQYILTKVTRLVASDVFINGEPVDVSVSVGAALFPDHGVTLSSLKRKAEVAMLRAKDEGKNGFVIYHDGMLEDVKNRIAIERDLLLAIEDNQLELFFQPRVLLLEQKVVACEALVRWHHPTQGLLAPNFFIPHASESRQIIEIDHFVIAQACQLIGRWQKERIDCQIAIKLSAWHFNNFNIIAFLKRHMDKHGVAPGRLEVEISESMLREEPGLAKKVLIGIKELGVNIVLDEFGAGCSSLNYLRTIPIDRIKLDQYFTQELDMIDRYQPLMRAIIVMGRDLGIPIIATGVETESQIRSLEAIGCIYAQGNYFLKPSPEIEVRQWLKAVNISEVKRPQLDLV